MLVTEQQTQRIINDTCDTLKRMAFEIERLRKEVKMYKELAETYRKALASTIPYSREQESLANSNANADN